MKITDADLVPLSDQCRMRSFEQSNIVKIRRGMGLNLGDLSPSDPPWKAFQVIAQGRVRAVSHMVRRKVLLTHQSALVVHEIPSWNANPPIRVQVDGRFRKRTLPAVVCPQTTVPTAEVIESRRQVPAHAVEIRDGLQVTTLEWTAIHMALDGEPVEAFVAVSAILRKLTHFDRFAMTASRRREALLKEQLLGILGELSPRTKGHRAYLILKYSDAACESVGERALLWVLTTIQCDDLETQYEIRVNGQRYFVDFAFPHLRIIIEFDGIAKLGQNQQEFHEEKRQFLRRQRDLEEAGWAVLRVTWQDFGDFEALRSRLADRIARICDESLVSSSYLAVTSACKVLWPRRKR